MAQYSLTDVKVRKIIPDPAKRIEIWDSKTPGFGVRVAPSGTKSFVLLYRQNGRARRMTLGRYPALSLADARQMAMDRPGTDVRRELAGISKRIDDLLREDGTKDL